MGLELLLQSTSTAAATGMGCGSCCGTGLGMILSGYLMTHARDFRHALGAFFSFFLGKVMAVMAVCAAASWAGTQIIGTDGTIGSISVSRVVDGVMLAMGLFFLYRWFRERTGHVECSSCNHCEDTQPSDPVPDSMHLPALWGMGVGYGISPCAPLLLMAGYAATLPLGYALGVGGVFAATSMLSPLLLLLLLSGILAGRIYSEIPKYLTWFRLGCYLLIIAYAVVRLYTH